MLEPFLSMLISVAAIAYFSREARRAMEGEIAVMEEKLCISRDALIKSRKETNKAREEILSLNVMLEVYTLRGAPSSPLSQAKIKKLLSLCHPDRHGNTATSNEMTAWLLEQRR